jgi:hypothetical protein
MAVGHGALWLMLTRPPGTAPPNAIVRVDLSSDHAVTEIPIDGACAADLVVGGGAVWTWGIAEDERAYLCQIDPSIKEVVSTVELPGGTLGPMVATHDGVWIARLAVPEGGEFITAARSVLRIDPHTSEIVGAIPADVCTLIDANCTPTWAAQGEDSVWFEGYRLGKTIRIDTQTNEARTISSGASCGLAVGERWAWVGIRADDTPQDVWNVAELVVRMDPSSGDLVGEPIPMMGDRQTHLMTACPYEAGAGGLWVAGTETGTGNGILARLDAETLKLGRSVTISKDGNWPALAFDFEAQLLWLGKGDSVTSIRLS